ncbi:hypothetical protein F4815DRAFT_159695 [Daldinia loculata]|nr:hypothetical protein F4815DRAFT_159695 [Daldinia loculata]
MPLILSTQSVVGLVRGRCRISSTRFTQFNVKWHGDNAISSILGLVSGTWIVEFIYNLVRFREIPTMKATLASCSADKPRPQKTHAFLLTRYYVLMSELSAASRHSRENPRICELKPGPGTWVTNSRNQIAWLSNKDKIKTLKPEWELIYCIIHSALLHLISSRVVDIVHSCLSWLLLT